MFRLPLVRDRISTRTQRAAVELSEADLRLLAVAASHAATSPPIGWNHSDDAIAFDGLGRRLARVADELRREARTQPNGAAPVAPGPRHDSQEAVS